MAGFVLCHGWGHDARSLDALAAALRVRFPASEVLVQDLGFFGEPSDALARAAARDDGEWIGVGHSWGFAWLAARTAGGGSASGRAVPAGAELAEEAVADGMPAPRWRALVSLNGFLRFCRAPGRRTGTPARAVDAMLARLATDADGCLADFRARCGQSSEPADPSGAHVAAPVPRASSPGIERLTIALRALRDSDLPPPVGTPLLALASAGDLIVPPDHARAQFDPAVGGCATEFALLPGSHLLPVGDAGGCADAIARFVGTLPACE